LACERLGRENRERSLGEFFVKSSAESFSLDYLREKGTVSATKISIQKSRPILPAFEARMVNQFQGEEMREKHLRPRSIMKCPSTRCLSMKRATWGDVTLAIFDEDRMHLVISPTSSSGSSTSSSSDHSSSDSVELHHAPFQQNHMHSQAQYQLASPNQIMFSRTTIFQADFSTNESHFPQANSQAAPSAVEVFHRASICDAPASHAHMMDSSSLHPYRASNHRDEFDLRTSIHYSGSQEENLQPCAVQGDEHVEYIKNIPLYPIAEDSEEDPVENARSFQDSLSSDKRDSMPGSNGCGLLIRKMRAQKHGQRKQQIEKAEDQLLIYSQQESYTCGHESVELSFVQESYACNHESVELSCEQESCARGHENLELSREQESYHDSYARGHESVELSRECEHARWEPVELFCPELWADYDDLAFPVQEEQLPLTEVSLFMSRFLLV
jgi:hypothetical protein